MQRMKSSTNTHTAVPVDVEANLPIWSGTFSPSKYLKKTAMKARRQKGTARRAFSPSIQRACCIPLDLMVTMPKLVLTRLVRDAIDALRVRLDLV